MIRAQVLRLDEHDMVADEALTALIGQAFLGGTVTKAWVEDGWVQVEAQAVDLPFASDMRGLSLGFDDGVPPVPLPRDILMPPPWKALGKTTSGGEVFIAPVGTLPPDTTPER